MTDSSIIGAEGVPTGAQQRGEGMALRTPQDYRASLQDERVIYYRVNGSRT